MNLSCKREAGVISPFAGLSLKRISIYSLTFSKTTRGPCKTRAAHSPKQLLEISLRQNCWVTHSTHWILLPLLPSGPDGFHKATLREAQQNCQYFNHSACQPNAGPRRQYLCLLTTVFSAQYAIASCPCGEQWRRGRDSNPR